MEATIIFIKDISEKRIIATDEQAEPLFSRLVKEYAEKEGVTEQLKSADQMAWVRQMNNIRSRVVEVINKELIYT